MDDDDDDDNVKGAAIDIGIVGKEKPKFVAKAYAAYDMMVSV